MKRAIWLFVAAFLLYLVAALALPVAIAFSEEVALPQDQDKLHISVIGEQSDEQYQRILGWFRYEHPSDELVALRKRVHFHAVEASTAIFRERYKPNIEGLPTVRVQGGDGVVIYEKAGNDLPTSAHALHSDINLSILATQVAPWRQQRRERWEQLKQKCCPLRHQREQQQIEPEEEEEEEVLDSPVFESVTPGPDYTIVIVVAVVLSALVGAIAGVIVEWRKTYSGPPVK